MVNTKVAATMLGVSPKTIYRMEAKGIIGSVRTPGGQRRFAKTDIEDYLQRSRTFTAPQNPSKYKTSSVIKDASDPSMLFQRSDSENRSLDRQIDRIERFVSVGSSGDHRRYYDNRASHKSWIEEWDFKEYPTKIYTHGFHMYPAMFIPQVARKLITEFSNEGEIVGDIFCGSGTTMVESSLLKRNSIGIELNPLAVLIARVKTTPIDPRTLTDKLKSIVDRYRHLKTAPAPSFSNVEFWFGKKTIHDLSRLRQAIREVPEENIRDFFLVCLSEVVRVVSFTRHNEFKLFRAPNKLTDGFKPEALNEFVATCERNILSMKEYVRDRSPQAHARIIMGDSTADNGIPRDSIDFIITSPPYGDSRTTVAYGQFSRLSSQWLDLLPPNIKDLDKELMGGKNNVDIDAPILEQSETLRFAVAAIGDKDRERAKDVIGFYADLHKALQRAREILKPQKYFCLIVGNRTVKEIVLKTDAILCEMGEKMGFVPRGIFYRNIPNKRMPLKNSPTNEPGRTGYTMHREAIVLLKKE